MASPGEVRLRLDLRGPTLSLRVVTHWLRQAYEHPYALPHFADARPVSLRPHLFENVLPLF